MANLESAAVVVRGGNRFPILAGVQFGLVRHPPRPLFLRQGGDEEGGREEES